jgi:SAM-dependent methyltransferase
VRIAIAPAKKHMPPIKASGMNAAELLNTLQNERDHWWYRGMRSILSALLERHIEGRRVKDVLEAGCGTGYTAQWLQTLWPWNIVLSDIESLALTLAKGLGASGLLQADICQLPFASAQFELILCLDVLVHLPPGEEDRCLSEFFRALKPGGFALLRVAALNSLRSRHSEFVEEKQRFTRKQLMRSTAQAGFRVLRCTYINCLLLPVAIAKFRVWEPLVRKPPASGIERLPRPLAALFYLCLSIEARWIRSGLDLPLGQSLLLLAEKPN